MSYRTLFVKRDREAESGRRAATSFQQHLAILSLLLKGDHDAAADRFRRGDVESEDFARFIGRHRLNLFFFSLLDGSPIRKSLPPERLNELKRFSLKQWATQERLVRELTQLSTLLTAAGHEFILLKGPYLATRFFGGMDRREFSDLDILVRKENLAAIERLLSDSGYIQKSCALVSRPLTTHFTNAFDFVKSNVAVDLHWRFSAHFTHRLDYEAIWQRKQSFVLRGHNYQVLSDEYELVFKLISIFTDLEMGMAHLRAFVDLYFILEKVSHRLDWEAFLEGRKRERTRRMSLTLLALFLEFFDCRDRFKEVAAVVDRGQARTKVVSPKHHQALMEAAPGKTWNKIWGADLYECPRFAVFLWWVVSFPFRLAVYNQPKYARIKRRLQKILNPLSPPAAAEPVDPPAR